nr:MAG TPA: hypothetical protein [Caudoviricetes sp.]
MTLSLLFVRKYNNNIIIPAGMVYDLCAEEYTFMHDVIVIVCKKVQ